MLFLTSVSGFILFSLIGNLVLYRSFGKKTRENRAFRKIWMAQSIGLAFLPIILFLLSFWGGLSTDSRLFMWGIFVFVLFSIPLIFFLLYSGIAILPLFRLQRIQKLSRYIGWFCTTVFFGTILYGGLIGRQKLTVQRETIWFTRLPESFDGLRIVQFSDLHLGSLRHNPAFIQEIADTINALTPDLIFFTGDLVNSLSEEASPFKDILAQLHAEEGVYSVLGNHDYGYYHRWDSDKSRLVNLRQLMELQDQAGWTLLNNRHLFLKRDNDSIAIIGVENWGEKQFGQQGDLQKAIQGVPPSTFSLLLSHNPIHWSKEVIKNTPIDLTFSGHTHAMQTQIGSFSPSSWIYPHWGGLYQDGQQFLNVNRGTGFVVFPARIGAYPEITLIELRHKKE